MGIERRKKTYMSHFAIWFVSANQPESMSFHNELSSSIPSILLPCSCLYFFFNHWMWNVFWAAARGKGLYLVLSPSLSASCQVIGTIFPLFLSSIPSLHLPPPTKPVTPPPHHTLFTRTSASTLCRVRAGDEGGSGRFWLTKMLRCNLVQAEMWSVHFWLGVCVSKREGAGPMCDPRFIASQAHLFVFYTSFRLRRAGSTFWLRVTQFHSTMRLSLSNNITYLF